jgi:hypothetical protein
MKNSQTMTLDPAPAAGEARVPALTDILWGRLRRVHGWTNGISTDVLNKLLVAGRRAANTVTATSTLLDSTADPAQARQYADQVRRDSQTTLPMRLDPATCDDIVRFCLSLKCEPYPRPAGSPEDIVLDLSHPVAPMNTFRTKHGIHRHPVIAALMNDPVLLAIARDYLRCEPILSSCLVWASPAFGERPSSEAAQLYHFDMAHPHFIKFFVYLTDVGRENGPHCVVRGTHGRDVAGWKHRFWGERIADQDIERSYPGRERELTGPKGTIIAEDTRAFHKGKHPTGGVRFVLELYFANAIVGRGLPEPERIRRGLGAGV